MNETKPLLGIKDKPSATQWVALSLQHLFAMFGATVLVPFFIDMSPAVALISSGLGTIAFLLITQFKVPAYLGSSFAFIAPVVTAKTLGGPGAAMIGTFIAGIVYGIVALTIKKVGYKWIMNILPPIVVGPVIMVIGLGLASTAVGQAMYKNFGSELQEYSLLYVSVALVTLIATILFTMFGKGVLSFIPILLGIIIGYVYALLVGVVNFQGVIDANWFAMPEFLFPFVDYDVTINGVLLSLFVPVAIVTLTEHIGHQLVLGKVVGKDYIKDPGLHRSILGDGTATLISALMGGPAKTTYGENIGVLAITRVYSVYVLFGAAVLAVFIGFIGKVTALIQSIPTPVMGGVSILLFGIIAASGLRIIVESKIDFNKNRNLVIASVILVTGIGGLSLHIGNVAVGKGFVLEGMALSAILGIILNLVLPGREKEAHEESIAVDESK